MAYLSPPSGVGTNANSPTQLAERAAALAWRFAQRFGAALKLLNASERGHSTLYISRLLPVVPLHKDEGEALADFS